jgi:hypothetical protein
LLQGPTNKKQVVDIYSEDGLLRPFFAEIETPGSGYVVKVTNTATVEFPIYCAVEPNEIADGSTQLDPVVGGDNAAFRVDQW